MSPPCSHLSGLSSDLPDTIFKILTKYTQCSCCQVLTQMQHLRNVLSPTQEGTAHVYFALLASAVLLFPFSSPSACSAVGASQALGKVGSTLLCPSSAFLSADVLLLCGGGQGFGEGVSGMSRQVEVEEEKTSSTTQKLHRLP